MDDGLGLGHSFGLLRHQRLHRSLILVEVDSRLVFSGGTTLGIATFSREGQHGAIVSDQGSKAQGTNAGKAGRAPRDDSSAPLTWFSCKCGICFTCFTLATLTLTHGALVLRGHRGKSKSRDAPAAHGAQGDASAA